MYVYNTTTLPEYHFEKINDIDTIIDDLYNYQFDDDPYYFDKFGFLQNLHWEIYQIIRIKTFQPK